MDKIMVTIMERKSYYQTKLKFLTLVILSPVVIPPSYGTTQSTKRQFDLFD